ncbi:hypothetical protein C8046_11530 [Serinibacter arcticus]|uniref:YbaB/EbfC DNA-binding family protein n=1 Tax=Serinibacter arcticus TaxID=1655435 RepID=A0A2U1ZW20_9MICO|nr:hypothetical protein [Serinibacter arcticus]PWD51186.1 hypothetical protein C8046_11530 [Serinibacter arcticus]
MSQLPSLSATASDADRTLADLRASAALLSATGIDETRNVEVRMVEGRLTEAVVHDVWRSALEPRELGDAVLEAARDAGARAHRRLAEHAERAEHAGTHAPPSPSTPPLEHPTAVALPAVSPHAPATASLHAFADVLDELRDGMDVMIRAMESQVTGQSDDQPTPAPSQRRTEHVTLTFAGQALDGVRIDPQWAELADAGALSREITAALRRPAPASGFPGVDDADLAPLRALTALAADPTQLAARLRLTE